MREFTEGELDQLVRQHGGLVKSIALRLASAYGEEPEDLIQIGYMGLIKAVRRFEPERGLQFSTYAVPMITGEIRSQLRDQGALKMSRALKSDMAAVRRAENEYVTSHGISPHLTSLAKLTGFSPERVREALQASDSIRNMEDVDSIQLDGQISMWEDREEQNVSRIMLAEVLNQLEMEERKVIVLRYFKDFTQQKTADLLGITQVQVCRIEKKTLKKMAEKMSGEG